MPLWGVKFQFNESIKIKSHLINLFELATKNCNTIILFTDYKKITSKQMKAIRYYIESFLNEPIVMEFKSVVKANPLSTSVIVTKEMVARFNQMN